MDGNQPEPSDAFEVWLRRRAAEAVEEIAGALETPMDRRRTAGIACPLVSYLHRSFVQGEGCICPAG